MLIVDTVDVKRTITPPSKVERLQTINNARDDAQQYGERVAMFFSDVPHAQLDSNHSYCGRV